MITYDTTIMQTTVACDICKVIQQLLVAINSKTYISEENKAAISAGREVLRSRADALEWLKKKEVYFKKPKGESNVQQKIKSRG